MFLLNSLLNKTKALGQNNCFQLLNLAQKCGQLEWEEFFIDHLHLIKRAVFCLYFTVISASLLHVSGEVENKQEIILIEVKT